MMKTITILSTLTTGLMILSSCSLYKNIPCPAEFETDVHGSFAEMTIHESDAIVYGELIAVQHDSVFLLSDNILLEISTLKINNAKVFVAARSDHGGMIRTWGILLTVATPGTYGLWSIISFPLHMLILLPVITNASGNFIIEYPFHYSEKIPWLEVNKFSRFPQGIPENIQHDQIH
ncbi:MAG: hypothetical protein ACHQFW_05560 [Chitinophagales bacterium]